MVEDLDLPVPADLHEDDDPGGGVVVAAVGVHQTDRVHQRSQQGPQLGKVSTVNSLQ